MKFDTERDLRWKTAITKVQPNEIRLRGHRIDALMDQVTFSQAIYLALTGRLPSLEVGRLIDAILVSSIDHAASPSTLAARTAASTGAPMNAALAAGLLTINQYHGGAIQNCMEMIMQVRDSSQPLDEAASILVQRYKTDKRRLPGFGHRIHTADPRTGRLLALAESLGLAKGGIAALRAVENALNVDAKASLPTNVDGAIAALLLDLDIPSQLGNTFFMISRLPGLVAHVFEEQTRERPMRWIHPTDIDYDGPSDVASTNSK